MLLPPVGGDMSFTTGAADSEGVVAIVARRSDRLVASPHQAVMCGLVHGTTVQVVAARGCRSRYPPINQSTIRETDGIITREPGLTLMMCFADCVPLIVVDTAQRAIGLAHAGWRGTLAGMAGALVTAMQDAVWQRLRLSPCSNRPQYRPRGRTRSAMRSSPPLPQAYPDDASFHDERTRHATRSLGGESLASSCVRGSRAQCRHRVRTICTFTHGDRFFSHRYAQAHHETEGRFAIAAHDGGIETNGRARRWNRAGKCRARSGRDRRRLPPGGA